MKTYISKITMLTVLLLGGIALFVTGCDSEDSPDNDRISGEGALDSYFAAHPYASASRYSRDALLQVSPGSATVTEVGQQVLFRVVGGSAGGYTWDVSDRARGSIQPHPASSDAIYTARAIANNEVIVYDETGHAGIAFIVTAEEEAGDALAWEADPADRALNINEICALTASGGVPPYFWGVANPNGGLNTLGPASSVIYKQTGAGDNAVSLTDSATPPATLWIPIDGP